MSDRSKHVRQLSPTGPTDLSMSDNSFQSNKKFASLVAECREMVHYVENRNA